MGSEKFEGALIEAFEETKRDSHIIDDEGRDVCCCWPSEVLEMGMEETKKRNLRWPPAALAQKKLLEEIFGYFDPTVN